MMNYTQHTQLQNLKQGEELAILKDDFEGFEQVVEFPDLVIAKRNRNMGYAGTAENVPFEMLHHIGALDMYGYKSSYEALGLHLFRLLFSQERYIHLKITRQQSEIQHVFLDIDRTVVKDYGLKAQPLVLESYGYFREVIEKFPLSGLGFSHRRLDLGDAPIFVFGWTDYHKSYTEDRVKQADQIILNVTIDGLCALATVFLDMAAAENDRDEICLEHPTLGFGGTGNNSLEARFWLPKSLGFYCQNLDDLKL